MNVKQKKFVLPVIVLLLLATLTLFSGRKQADLPPQEVQIPGAGVSLDASIYYPHSVPAPLIMIAHGFGGDKNSVGESALNLQQAGYVVVTWSARGFGNSTGQINMNAPDKEVADASRIIDFLSRNNKVSLDSPSDPKVGVMGSSYGGALALMLAKQDKRIDAVVSDITWSDLRQALFPQNATPAPQAGPFKKVWAGTFFALTALRNSYLGQCGNFAPEWCAAFKRAMNEGSTGIQLTPTESRLLNGSSPASLTTSTQNPLQVPTLLMQGEDDSLFPLDESLSNISRLFQGSTQNLSLIWHSGGHDGGNPEAARLVSATRDWFDKYLRGSKKNFPRFQVTDTRGTLSVTDSTAVSTVLQSSQLPTQATITELPLTESLGAFFAPIGGQPAAISSLPGVGSAGSLAAGLLGSLGGSATNGSATTGSATNALGLGGISPALLPGQSAQFASSPVPTSITIVGSSQIKVRVTSTANDATLFFSLMAQSRNGSLRQPGGIVAPVRLTNIPKGGIEVTVTLPAVFMKVAAGESVVLAVSSTDQGYALPNDGRFYTVTPTSHLLYPTLPLSQMGSSRQLFTWPLITVLVLLLALGYLRFRRPKIQGTIATDDKHLIQISHLSKVYSDGYRAVDDLSFEVGRGQVLGLLGPNGAGKTTTLRMLMGLIIPTTGSIWIEGQPVYPGSPALAQLGSFVEGPGFLPHLTGRENLEIYWKSIGRQEDPRLDEVIAITKLGSALDKRVRSYSQGMRQRLAIAQAMLGLPDILVLDEPTNGLDPQQIVEMRKVLKKYAKGGRTVIVSSHLLAEIQQTCTHVVLMHRGKLLAAGTLRKILKKSTSLEEIFLEIIGDDLIIGGVKE